MTMRKIRTYKLPIDYPIYFIEARAGDRILDCIERHSGLELCVEQDEYPSLPSNDDMYVYKVEIAITDLRKSLPPVGHLQFLGIYWCQLRRAWVSIYHGEIPNEK